MSNLFSGIAQKYAKSILDSIDNINELEMIVSELQLVRDSLSSSINLWEYLCNKWVSHKEKISTWNKIALPVSKFVNATLSFMIANHRLHLLTDVIEQLEVDLYSMQHSMKVQVKTAAAVDDSVKNQLKNSLKNVFDTDIILDCIVDNSLVGGFVAYGDSVMLDLTHRRRINQLKKEFQVV